MGNSVMFWKGLVNEIVLLMALKVHFAIIPTQGVSFASNLSSNSSVFLSDQSAYAVKPFDLIDMSVLDPVSNPHGYVILEGYHLTSGHLRSFIVHLDRPYCMVSFQLWRKINVATNNWQIKFTTPVYKISTDGTVKIDVRHLDNVVWSMDKLGFLDLSITPCVTLKRQTDPIHHTQSLLYRPNRSELLDVNDERIAVPFQVSLDFNVRAKTEPYLGAPGAQGIVGIKGLDGEYGEEGYIGPQGPRGQRGDAGAIGSEGVKGPQGQRGFIGETGETGDRGISGEDKSSGIPGDTGEIGDIGPAGQTGDQGFSGLDGTVGSKGTTGDVGEHGYTGKPGDVLIGLQGRRGVQGDMGPIGFAGEDGDPGERGDVGDQGYLEGPRGPPGDPGSSFNPFGYDWCSTSSLGCSHACRNTERGAECVCHQGYSLSDDGSCEEIDECQTRNGLCQHTCTNVPGSYVCSCYLGYMLSADMHRCDDIDECLLTDVCDAEQVCVNVEGRHECLGPYTITGLIGKVANAQTMDNLLSTGTLTGITVWLIILSIVLIIEILLFFFIVSRENRALYRPMQWLVRPPEEPKVYMADSNTAPTSKYLSLPKVSYISYPSDKKSASLLDSVPYAQVQKLRLSRSNSLF